MSGKLAQQAHLASKPPKFTDIADEVGESQDILKL